jgi:hypothetical protein
MHYVLIIMFCTSAGTTATAMHTFQSEAACKLAEQAAFNAWKGGWDNHIYTTCTPE